MGYGEGLVSAADENKNIVALCADLTESTQTHHFQKKYPDRFVEMGVAEQNLASVASGMAAMGKIPFIASYAMFSPGRNWEQIRTTICYNEQNVKVVGAHAGVSVGPDGATHQAIEDIAIMRVIPHMVVLSPCDALEAKKATIAAARFLGPVYIRFHREKTPVFTTEETPFEIGKAEIFFEPSGEPDVAIIAMGPLVHNALLAAEALAKEGVGVRVINSPSVKPLDGMIVEKAARDAGCIVTVEEHQIAGGLGSAVAEFLSSIYPVPIEFIGMRDRFGESGEPDELVEYFGMGVLSIQEVVRKVMKRKK
ncbi:MAG: transketolase [Candidatus Ryanbacteria bacterium RIFCSPHIGHO2_12_FULL_47_12b]|uniref:Transketolase n=1 Tax=Candidatus Ryanbacteria bacterium RIFCSPLOWO2_12_FULL_47_9c TaxID=1802131 RepID=A0A1G2H5P7_9BACT|nr:MAG: transketolase [Candidatus Ryanbacteria bacterium RIFCSPHIGHO2_12_FULL_47_12b]OGZ52941.1 MAG: transketolase [Candidatus Ryanbacteria bacterium RIFCSPLOWO2_01_FULL_47_79]OGZ57650.1 MAG: transketolase [Candidatus Ryanbacteria bacterium RIFCSPLOWO2_12_FULL_47_9c]